MRKALLLFSILIAVIFSALKMIKIEAFTEFLDIVYWVIIIAATLFAAVRVLAGAAKLKDRDALFTGALGLGILAVSAVYYFAYTFIIGTETGLNISDFSDACSYLFFIAAVTILLLPPFKIERIFRIGVNAVYIAILFITVVSIITDNSTLMYVTVIITAFICSALSAYLLYQSRRIKQLRPAGLFACSMIFLGIVDAAVYTVFLTNAGDDWYQTFAVFYIPVFIWISEGLRNLRKGERRNG